jgi:transposase
VGERWRCPCPRAWCSAKTWIELVDVVDAQAVLTRRAGTEACCQGGEHARPVAQVAKELGVCWWTIMNAVITHGTSLVEDPDRVGPVHQLGIDETSYLAARREHATIYATGLIDLERHVVIDMVQGNGAADLRRWTCSGGGGWLAGIEVVATDLAESFRAGLTPGLAHARRVADPFHVVRVTNRCIDQLRRRVQNETFGHRRRTHDPLFRIGKLLLTGSNDWTRPARTAWCSACASASPTTKSSGRGWPRAPCASTTGSTYCFTPAASPGRHAHHRHASELPPQPNA